MLGFPSLSGRTQRGQSTVSWVAGLVVAVLGLWLVARMYALGEPVWAIGTLTLLGVGLYIYLSARTTAARYLFPGLAAMLVFVVFPMLLTLRLSTTNFSAANLLSYERARAYLLEQTSRDESRSYAFTLHGSGISCASPSRWTLTALAIWCPRWPHLLLIPARKPKWAQSHSDLQPN
jgi:maltose/maltodextrin transport system permease protein